MVRVHLCQPAEGIPHNRTRREEGESRTQAGSVFIENRIKYIEELKRTDIEDRLFERIIGLSNLGNNYSFTARWNRSSMKKDKTFSQRERK